ncbi:MAG: glycoside hydrolase family 16 [Caulobacteraceae bacterium]|nr:glycoside hydrolase family 16 [Caulobacteraceae bacterium]
MADRGGVVLPIALAVILAGVVGGLSLHAAAPGGEPLRTAPDGRRLTLTFSDDFDSLQRVRSNDPGGPGTWRTTFGDGSNKSFGSRTLSNNRELQLYVDPELADRQGRPMGLDPFAVHDGTLDLIARRAAPGVQPDVGGFAYTSGMISSQPGFAQLYGYFEARVKLPAGKGLWPAVWMLPADLSWPPEIDIMESIGDPRTAYMTIHSAAAKTFGVEVHPTSDGFHTYAVEWDPQQVVFYLDGVETQRAPTPADMHKPMFIVANLAVGGVWAGPPDQSTALPASFSIDYIRGYRFAP